MTEAIRHQDEQGNAFMWENPNGDESFVIDEDDRCIVVESPYGSPRTTDLEISFAAFRAGIGQDAVRVRFGEQVVQEILREISQAQTSGGGRAKRRRLQRSTQRSPIRRASGLASRLR